MVRQRVGLLKQGLRNGSRHQQIIIPTDTIKGAGPVADSFFYSNCKKMTCIRADAGQFIYQNDYLVAPRVTERPNSGCSGKSAITESPITIFSSLTPSSRRCAATYSTRALQRVSLISLVPVAASAEPIRVYGAYAA